MAAATDDEPNAAAPDESILQRAPNTGKRAVEHESEESDEDAEEADEEPKLKYTRITSSLAPVYRNGDAASTFMVAGDKMVWRKLPGSEPCPVASTC